MKLLFAFVALLFAVAFAADVSIIPGYGAPNTRTTSGYYSTAADNIGKAYYLFVEAESNPSTAPILVWFNGAPGCSSIRAAFYDIGPYEISTTGNDTIVTKKVGSWTKFANLLFIDAPVGSGYSYFAGTPTSRFPDSLQAAAQQISNVLLSWYSDNRAAYSGSVYFAGQNFGAKLAQSVGSIISTSIVPYSGLIMGNPWIDSAVQHKAWVEYSYQEGFIGLGQRISLNTQVAACQSIIASQQYSRAYLTCWSILSTIKNQTGIDTNDFITRAQGTSFAYIENYLNRADVRNAFNANPTNTRFQMCDNGLFTSLVPEIEKSTTALLATALSTKSVLIYNGEHDITTNTVGVKDIIYNYLTWPGRAFFNFANSQVFNVNGNAVGNVVQAYNLTYAIIYEAAADPARDQSDIVAQLITKWISKSAMCPDSGCTAAVAYCPNKCSNHGSCISNACKCTTGWSGADCSNGDLIIDAAKGLDVSTGYAFAKSWNEIKMFVPDYSIYLKIVETQFVTITVTLEQTSTTGDLWLYGTPFNTTVPVPSGVYSVLNNTRLTSKTITLTVPPKTSVRIGVFNNAPSEEGTYTIKVTGDADHEAGKIISDIVGLNFLYGFIVGVIVAIVLVFVILFIRCLVRCRKRYKRGGRKFDDDE